jgi:hypothetical protein
MVRKQIYIERRQQILLERLSRARGVSQAEIIRDAIEREAAGDGRRRGPPDLTAWASVLAAVEQRGRAGERGPAYEWNREDAYAEGVGNPHDRRTGDRR